MMRSCNQEPWRANERERGNRNCPSAQGKTNLMKKIKASEEVQQISLLMGDPSLTVEEIGKAAGVCLFVIPFGGRQKDYLNFLRYVEMVSSNKVIDQQKLPPTERAAHFHSLRVRLQLMLWKKLTHEDLQLDPKQWGWKLDGTTLTPTWLLHQKIY